MPSELVRRLDLDKIHPGFLMKALELLAACKARGATYYAISGYRSYSEQMKLYFQGRTSIGPIVTWARAGESAHNFGIAIDFCKDADADRAGLQPSWAAEDYAILGEEAARLGLEWGGAWKKRDRPHVQAFANLHMLRAAHESGGLPAVWRVLDERERNK